MQDNDAPVEFNREVRYAVFKIKDIEKYLSPVDRQALDVIAKKINSGRESDGKPTLNCVVVEEDWPEFEPTWSAISQRCLGL